MEKAKYNNGDLLKDKITGLDGIVMVVAHYATGCIHYGLQSRKLQKDGTPYEWNWLDQSRLECIKSCKIDFELDGNNTSGPSPKGPEI